MKVNFSEVKVKNIEGKEDVVSVAKTVGNAIYMQGSDIEECELGKKIYYADGDVELSDNKVAIVMKCIQGFPYIVRSAIEGMLKG